MADGYTSVYDTEDGSEAGTDFLVAIIVAFAGLAGLVALILVGGWLIKSGRKLVGNF
jgi:hypothetical protein